MTCRKLVLNILIFVVCGAVAITVPVLINHLSKPTVTANDDKSVSTNCILVSEFVGDDYRFTDTCIVWQVYLKNGFTVIATWNEIYAALSQHNPLIYDTEHLALTPYGLCYRGLQTQEDYDKLYNTGYTSSVTYQGKTCLLDLHQTSRR